MKNLCSLILRKWPIFVDPIKELSIFTVFHKDVNFSVSIDNLINLGNVLVKYMSLDVYLLLKSFQLLIIIAWKGANFDSHGLACW